jgi:hypothetical protein
MLRRHSPSAKYASALNIGSMVPRSATVNVA